MTLSLDRTADPQDPVGAATLEVMASAPAYNRWMYSRISRWVGSRVLEVGAGIGNISQFYLDRERVVLTDTESVYREELLRRFGEHRVAERRHSDVPVEADRRSGKDRRAARIEVLEFSLPEVPDELVGERFDTIICLNVLEHIEQDVTALRTLNNLLEPGGHLILLVPALPSIYGTLDRALGHYRRYTPDTLRSLYEDIPFQMRHLEYFNMPGIAGWWFTGRVLRRELIPLRLLSVYDRLVPLFRLERLLPFRVGQSLIAIGQRAP